MADAPKDTPEHSPYDQLEEAASATDPGIDPIQLQMLREQMAANQNLSLAIIAGGLAAVVSAALWAGAVVITGYYLGLTAIAVGIIVGFTVRKAGQGIDLPFGIVGAAWALAGVLLGNVLAIGALVSQQEDVAIMNVMLALATDVELLKGVMVDSFSPKDLLFYGIAVYEGYKFSLNKVALPAPAE